MRQLLIAALALVAISCSKSATRQEPLPLPKGQPTTRIASTRPAGTTRPAVQRTERESAAVSTTETPVAATRPARVRVTTDAQMESTRATTGAPATRPMAVVVPTTRRTAPPATQELNK